MAAGEPAMPAAVPEDCALGRIYDAAAHDLRASLRHIRLLLEWMVEDHRAELSEAAIEKLDGLGGCANRLDALVGGLVELMRLEAAAEPVQAIDAATLVAGALADAAPPPGFTVRVAGALPAFHGAPGLMRRVFAELIANAVTHHDRSAGAITISGAADAKGCRFRVSDDGPGIAPRFHGQVFEPFRTLKPHDEAAGNGLGLALVRRIVGRHGGQVRIEQPAGDRGCCLVLTLPDQRACAGSGFI